MDDSLESVSSVDGQDILILFNMIERMTAADAQKAIDLINDNVELLGKLAFSSKYARVQLKAKKKLHSIKTY